MLKKSLTIVSTGSFIHFFMLTLFGFQLKRQSTVPENIQHWLANLKTVRSVSISVVYCQSFSENILIKSGPEDLFQGPVT